MLEKKKNRNMKPFTEFSCVLTDDKKAVSDRCCFHFAIRPKSYQSNRDINIFPGCSQYGTHDEEARDYDAFCFSSFNESKLLYCVYSSFQIFSTECRKIQTTLTTCQLDYSAISNRSTTKVKFIAWCLQL